LRLTLTDAAVLIFRGELRCERSTRGAFVRAAVYPQGMGWVDVYAIPPAYRALPVAGGVSAALTAALVAASVAAWRSAAWSRGARARHAATVGAAVAFVLWLGYWRLLGPAW
jgi:hypothetical protein